MTAKEFEGVAILGAGNLGTAIAEGLLATGLYDPERIVATRRRTEHLSSLAEEGIRTTSDNREAVRGAEVVLVCVQPQQLDGVLDEIAAELVPGSQIVISTVSGATIHAIREHVGTEIPVVRAMPNTPALLGCGPTGRYAKPAFSARQRDLAESVLRSVGVTRWVDDESAMDAVTAVSGSGPAYFFLFMEALTRAAEDAGLDAESARLLVLETAFGAAKMALESAEDVATLRRRVTSPGGTTERALAALEQAGLREAVRAAVGAARDRAGELGDQLGSDR